MKHPPLKLEMMLHCYYKVRVTRDEFIDQSSAHCEFYHELLNEGLIEQLGDGVVHTTDRGRAWVALLGSTPYPQRQEIWVDRRNNEPIDYL